MSTVTSVSAFLAGFSLASVVVIADGPEHFRWPGVAVLAMTIASVVLILAAQGSRRGAYYYERSTEKWRRLIWAMYHGGIVALLVGLGAALAPQDGAGTGGQHALRWAAAWFAFAAAGLEVLLAVASQATGDSGAPAGDGDRPWPPGTSKRAEQVVAQDGEVA